MKSSTQISISTPLICLLGLVMSNTVQHIDAEIYIPPIQNISIINQKGFEDLKKSHLDNGYYILSDCVELEIKSNTDWSLIVIDEDAKNDDNFFLRVNELPFKPLSSQENILIPLKKPTSSTIISIDCKRVVSWGNTKQKPWNFSPIFKLVNLK